MEGTDAVGKIEIVAGAAARDDVHGAAQRVAAEAGGNHTFVYFHAVDDVHGQVGQRHAGPLGVERHPVEEIADGVAAHPVDRQVEFAAYPALFADPDAGRPVDGLGQRLERAGLQTDIERAHSESPFAKPLLPALGRNRGIAQLQGIAECSAHSEAILPPKRNNVSQKGEPKQANKSESHPIPKLLLPESFKNNDPGRSSGLSPPRRLPVPKDSDSG